VTGRFENKVAIVTGGAAGIGAATAQRLASEGAAVVVADLNLERAKSQVAAIADAGGAALAVGADLRDEDSLRAMAASAVESYGGIDLLVNNAALGLPDDLDVVSTPQEVWDGTYDVNLMGFVRTCRQVIPAMLERGGGAIVNMSSTAGLIAERHRTAYGTSKAAIAALTRNVAVTYARRGIRCNAVAPGMIGSETVLSYLTDEFKASVAKRTPLGRIGRPEEMAALITFLLSDDASYVTGQTIMADGGLLISAG
jgi:NAD(P)-dependent dehydrogenase (short-subunit alcohol dehydrogenase family)